ncbi:MAG: FKBP-type peptidyl-prolyl cis-trans isomerase [Chitinophagaceae bacterium]
MMQRKSLNIGLDITHYKLPKIILMRVAVVILLAFSFIVSGCAKSSSSFTCSYDPCALKAPASEVTQLETYLSGAGITTATKHCSGLYYQIKSAGSGTTPTTCSNVSVTYKGTLTNGNVFDQSTSAVAFPLATLIEGWKKGIPLISKGGSITLYLPPTFGYGATDQKDPQTGNVIIPANSIIIFDIQLVDVQ